MKTMIEKVTSPGLIIMGILLLMSCNEPTLESAWRPSDSTEAAKSKYSSYILNGEDVVVALQNDDQNLYLRIKATNTASQIKMAGGLTVWLDSDGKKGKIFGIEYPIPRTEMMPPGGKFGEHKGERPDGGPPNGEGGFEKQERFNRPGGFGGMGMGNKDSMLVLGPGKNEKHTVDIHNNYGLSALITHDNGPMIYDLVIPLKHSDNNPYAIDIKPGKLISLGIETATSQNRAKRMNNGEHPKHGDGDGETFGGSPGGTGTQGGFGDGGDWGNGGDSGDGMPGGGGMGGTPGGGHGPGGGRSRLGGSEEMKSSPVKFWAKIRLAAEGQTAQ